MHTSFCRQYSFNDTRRVGINTQRQKLFGNLEMWPFLRLLSIKPSLMFGVCKVARFFSRENLTVNSTLAIWLIFNLISWDRWRLRRIGRRQSYYIITCIVVRDVFREPKSRHNVFDVKNKFQIRTPWAIQNFPENLQTNQPVYVHFRTRSVYVQRCSMSSVDDKGRTKIVQHLNRLEVHRNRFRPKRQPILRDIFLFPVSSIPLSVRVKTNLLPTNVFSAQTVRNFGISSTDREIDV